MVALALPGGPCALRPQCKWVGRDGGASEGNPTQARARLPDLEGAWDVDFPRLSQPTAQLVVRVLFGEGAFFPMTSNPSRAFSLPATHPPGGSTSLPLSLPTSPVQHWAQRWGWDGVGGKGWELEGLGG